MKKFLSLMIAMIMLLTCAALAESETSQVTYFALVDPVVSVDGAPLLDMTGLAVELDVIVADSSNLMAVILQAMVGENFDTSVVYGEAQMDENGVVMGADGLSNLYSLDFASLGMSGMGAQIFANSKGATSPLTMTDADLAQQIIDALSVSSDENGVHQLALSREDGAKMIQPYLAMAANAMGQSASELEGVGLELTGEGSVGEDGSASIALDGMLSKEGEEETFPVSFSFTVSAEGSEAISASVTGEEFSFNLTSTVEMTTDENGTQSTGTISATAVAEGVTYAFDTDIQGGTYTTPVSDWALDGSDAIDVMNMDESQMTALQMGGFGILGNAMTLLQENVPGLAEPISALASGMMG